MTRLLKKNKTAGLGNETISGSLRHRTPIIDVDKGTTIDEKLCSKDSP